MVSLTVLSVFSILSQQAKADPEVTPLPAPIWHPHWKQPDSIDSARLDRIDLDPITSGDQQIVTVGLGEEVTIDYSAWLVGNPGEIRQLWFVYSWASSYPPWDAYTPIYNGGPYPSKTVPGSFSITAPSTSGTYKVWLCVESKYSMNDAVAEVTEEPTMLPHAAIEVVSPTVPATVDIDPDTLNLKSNGQWITAYITLPEGYSVEDIDVNSVELRHDSWVNSTVWGEVQDGVLMVKFDRASLRDYLGEVDVDDGDKFNDITLTITGIVAGTLFEGSDTITVKRK